MPSRRGRGSRRSGFGARSKWSTRNNLISVLELRRSTGSIAAPITPQPEAEDGIEDVPEELPDDTPQPDEDNDDQPEGDEAGTPAGDSEAADDPSNPPTPQNSQSVPQKRKPGRPPRTQSQALDWGTPEAMGDEGSETGTPARRRRGRPSVGGGWRGGFRGRARGGARGPSHITRAPIDKQGNSLNVIDDEVVMSEDAEGETKVDKNGYLLGGRDYRVRVFTIKGRGRRLYMLSTEPARCTGFRDSYLFFTKHLTLFKIIIDDEEKRDLIERDVIPHSYKGRAIGVVTARSVFREFGAKIVINGRKITDDYQAQAARDRGDVEGELADPTDRLPSAGQVYNKNQYVAWHGASSVYHNNAPAVPMPVGRPPALGKLRKSNITTTNWMLEHALNASNFNSTLRSARQATDSGVYEPHTNLMHYPTNTQPTSAKWEHVSASGAPLTSRPESTTRGYSPTATHITTDDSAAEQTPSNSMFEPVSSLVSRNYVVVDTHLQTAPLTGLTLLQPNMHLGYTGAGLPDVSEDDLTNLPDECRVALAAAKQAEAEWRSRWPNEQIAGLRGRLRIGVGGI